LFFFEFWTPLLVYMDFTSRVHPMHLTYIQDSCGFSSSHKNLSPKLFILMSIWLVPPCLKTGTSCWLWKQPGSKEGKFCPPFFPQGLRSPNLPPTKFVCELVYILTTIVGENLYHDLAWSIASMADLIFAIGSVANFLRIITIWIQDPFGVLGACQGCEFNE
jgi:hypothetical protein